ncbi:MAG: hypothetical protein V4486_00395 [Patescibacteria group bacterium]
MLLTSLFLFINTSALLDIGWGRAQNFELGWIFLGPLMILESIILSLAALAYLRYVLKANKNPIIVFWCLFSSFIVDFTFIFFTDHYHSPFPIDSNPFLSLNIIIITAAVILTAVFSLISLRKDELLSKKFKNKLILAIICFVIYFAGVLAYSIHYRITTEEANNIAQEIVDKSKAKDQQDWNDALSSGFKVAVLLNGKSIPNAELYYRITRRDKTITDNKYIYNIDNEGDGLALENDRMPPGDYIIAPIIGNECDAYAISALGKNPNLDVNKLNFRGPYYIGSKILNLNIDISNAEYQILLKMQPPHPCKYGY